MNFSHLVAVAWLVLAIAVLVPAGAGAGESGLHAATPAPLPQALAAGGCQGGFIVHLGCGDAKRTLQLRAGDNCLVQGLDTSREEVSLAREKIAARGLYGEVTAREFDGKNLPYSDSMVNLLVVENAYSVSREEMVRVLCPRGSLCRRQGDHWSVETKPWPADLDEWTHYQHDPQGTMVGKDSVVGPPRRIQWVGGPKWLRNHDFMSSMHAMVSSQGRIFYIIDEGLRNHVFLPARWTLIARDGFNGAILWKKSLKDWHPANWPLKSGPGYLPRRLVALGDRVYVTLGLAEPLSAVDAVTGQVLQTYEGTKTTEEIALADGVLYLLVNDRKPVDYRAETATYQEINRANTGWGWTTQSPARSIVAIEAETGKLLWKHTDRVAPLTLTVGQTRVLFFDGEKMVALERQTGSPLWASERPGRVTIRAATGEAPRVILSDSVAVFCTGTEVFGFAEDTGKLLWQGKIPPTGHHCPSDLFVINGLVWSAHTGRPQETGTPWVALDLHTGQTVKDFTAENIKGFPMHPRCYPGRATERYIMTAGMGTEFYAVGGNQVEVYDYVRGSCIYGIMPCNGLLYKPPDSCCCYYLSKLEDLCALAPAGGAPARPIPEDQRLEHGPAYGDVGTSDRPESTTPNADEWPMYRRDAARSGSSPSPVSAELKPAWSASLGGKLSQPVVAGGKVYVAAVDAGTVYALDAAGGKVAWKYLAGSRVDSPPAVLGDKVCFGSADGWVYCLRAADGALAWRYLAAPEDRQIISYQRPESAWPVSGSVLVHGNTVYALAGRNRFFDGGMRLVLLDAATGRKLSETRLDELDPQTGLNLQTRIVAKTMPVANADLLSSDGKKIYLASAKFDLQGKQLEVGPVPVKPSNEQQDRHLFCQTGFLDDVWYHRSYFVYGESALEGWGDYYKTQRQTPCGRLMVLDETRAYGFRPDNLGNTLLPTPMYRLYASDKDVAASATSPPAGKRKGTAARRGEADQEEAVGGGAKVHWQIPSPPLLVNAMALAGKSLFIAGPPDVADETKMLGFLPGAGDETNRQLNAQDDAWRGKLGGLLWVVSAAEGKKLAEYRLESVPVWDGMAVAEGKLFIVLKNGAVSCFEKK